MRIVAQRSYPGSLGQFGWKRWAGNFTPFLPAFF
jgi:hypothetical protein